MDELREALLAADYTYAGVSELLGPVAQAALGRNETTPALRATRGGTPRETLTRLWLLQTPVSLDAAEAALPGLVDRLCTEGILERSVGEVAARVDVRPYASDDKELWVLADLTPGLDGAPNEVGPDHVLGISSAATSLAQMTIRGEVGSALDLGTGCGVQALHLADHVGRIVATDVNKRALWLTRLNAELNGVADRIEVRDGSYFEPVAREAFDLIVTNPPFVISPGTGQRLVYRDSGLPGDAVVEHIVRAAPGHLTPGGACQILGNWIVSKDQPWDERLAGWIDGCDAWVVQRELVDLPTYVELWLKDAGLHGAGDYQRRYDTWLSWFDEQGVEAVGFGWIHLRRTDQAPSLRLEEWPYDVAQPLGDEVAAHFARTEYLRNTPDLSDRTLRKRADVLQETTGAAGAEDPESIVLRQQVGMRRARRVDTAQAAFVGACDGDLSVGALSGAVTQLTGSQVAAADVRDLVAEGFLIPSTGAR